MPRMANHEYAGYPDAKVYDQSRRTQIQHLVWGDWVQVLEKKSDGWCRVHSRGTDGWMRARDLQADRPLEVVFVDVGQGDGCLVVTPDDRHLVVDAGDGDNLFRFLRWRYRGFRSKWTFDAAFITHPDRDHYAGFTPLFENENVHFNVVFHNGIVERRGKHALGEVAEYEGGKYLTEVVTTRAGLRKLLSDEDNWKGKLYPALLNRALLGGRVEDIRMLSTDHSAAGYVAGYGADDPVRLRVLGPVVEWDGSTPLLKVFGDEPGRNSLNAGKTKNGHSIVLMLEYGEVRILLGGDLNRPAEDYLLRHHTGLTHPYPWTAAQEEELVGAARPIFRADVAKSCHHGSHDVTDAMLAAIGPAATVISSGDAESHAHPRPETLGALGRHGRGPRPLILSTELLRSTREDEGRAREDIAALRERIARAETPAAVAAARAELDRLVDRLADRNVTVYGAVNVRTDGTKIVIAYKLEKPRSQGQTLTKWDVYPLERGPDGQFAHEPTGGH